jgi:hypothetical protein
MIGSGPGKDQFLHVKWCNGSPNAAIERAVTQTVHRLSDGQDPLQPCSPDQEDEQSAADTVVPLSDYMRAEARSVLQAATKAFLLKQHFLPAARLQRRLLRQGDC